MEDKEALYEEIYNYIYTLAEAPFTYAREVAEAFNITSQKASGALRVLEQRELIVGKKIKAGRNEVKCYFTPKEDK